MAAGSYTLEQEKKKLSAQQKKAADTGKAAGIGAGAGAAAGAGGAALAFSALNAIPVIGNLGWLGAISIGAIVGAVSGSSIGVAVSPGSFEDIISGGDNERSSIEQQLEIIARAGEMSDRLRQIGNKTYIKVSGLRPTRSTRGTRDVRNVRDTRLTRNTRGVRYERSPRYEQWVQVNQTAQEAEAQNQAMSAFANYSDPSQINDPLDVLSRAINQPFAEDSITGDWGEANFLKYATGAWVIDVTHAFVDSTFWDLDGEGNSFFQNVVYRPIEQAAKGEISVGTMFAALGINMLGAVGQTLDVLANPMKGLLKDGLKGAGAAWGIGTGGERTNYDFDTGNIVSDIILEIAFDPMNWITLGGKAVAGFATKTVRGGIKEGVETTIKELGQETGQKTSKIILEETLEKASKTVVKEGEALTAKIVVDATATQATKNLGQAVTKQMSGAFEQTMEIARKQLAQEVLDRSTVQFTKKTADQILKEAAKEITEEALIKRTGELLGSQLSKKTTTRVINQLIDQGFDLAGDVGKAVSGYVDDVVKKTVMNQMTHQIQKSLGTGVAKLARGMMSLDNVMTKWGVSLGTLGMADVMKFTLRRSGLTRVGGKLLSAVPGKVKAAAAGAAVGAAAGAIIGGQIDEEDGAGWGALTGSVLGALSATSIAIIGNGATMRSIMKGVPQGSEIWKKVQAGKIPFNEYKDFVDQYEALFDIYSRSLDGKVLTDKQLKSKIGWYTKNTVEGLNPVQMHTLRQIYIDNGVLAQHMKQSKNAGDIKSAWARYIKETHGMTVAKYSDAIKKIGVIEKGQFVQPISRLEVQRLLLDYQFLEQQIADPKNVGRLTADKLKKSQERLLKKSFETFKASMQGKVLSASVVNRKIALSNNVTYYSIVRSDVAMLDEYVDAFSKNQRISETLMGFVEDVNNSKSAFTTLYNQTKDVQELQTYLNLIRQNLILRKEGYSDTELSNALIRSFWDLKNAPYGASTEELTELWLRRLNVYGHGARKAGQKGMSNFGEFRDELHKIVAFANDDGMLTRTMRSFENINSQDGFLYRATRTHKNNMDKIRRIDKKLKGLPVKGEDLPKTTRDLLAQRALLQEQNTALTEWRVWLAQAQGTKFETKIPGLETFASPIKTFEELQNASSFSALMDLQKSLGIEYQIESGANTYILGKFFDFAEGAKIDTHTLDALNQLTQNAMVANSTINNMRSLYKGRAARKQLDAMWDLLLESINDSGHPFLNTLRRDLTTKERYAFLYAVSQAVDYGTNSQALKAIFQPYFDAVKSGKVPYLQALLKSPDSLGFGNFRPGLRNQIETIINKSDPTDITSCTARKSIIEAQADTTLDSLTATDLRLRKSKTISNPKHLEEMLQVNKATKDKVSQVHATANLLGEQMDARMAVDNAGGTAAMLKKLQTLPQSFSDGSGTRFFTDEDIEILKNLWEKGEVPPGDTLRKIARKAEAYQATRWDAIAMTDKYITDPKLNVRTRAFLGAKSGLQPIKDSTGKMTYAGRYSDNKTMSSLRKPLRAELKEALKSSGLDEDTIKELSRMLYDKKAGSVNAFEALVESYRASFDEGAAERILELIQPKSKKFTNGDALRYLITKNSPLDAAEFAEYVRIMNEFDRQFFMAEIPMEFLPNSYKKAWIQNRLGQINSQVITNPDMFVNASVEITGYKNLMDGVQTLGVPAHKTASLAYLEQFAQVPGNMLARMKNASDAAFFRSILETLPSDEAFWSAARGWENYINRYYGAQYQAVYIANYAEMLQRGQVTVSKTFNMNNSEVRRATMLDLMSGNFEPKLDTSSYRSMLSDAGVRGVPKIDVPVQQQASVTFRFGHLSDTDQQKLNPILYEFDEAQKALDKANAVLQQNTGTRELELELASKRKAFKIKDLPEADKKAYNALKKESEALRKQLNEEYSIEGLDEYLAFKKRMDKAKNKAPSIGLVEDQWSNEYARYVETVLRPLQAEDRLFESRIPKQIRDLVESGLTTKKQIKTKLLESTKLEYERVLNELHALEAKVTGPAPITAEIIAENEKAVRAAERQMNKQIEILKKLETDGMPIRIWVEPKMPGSHTMFYPKMREMQSGIIASLDLQHNPVVMPLMHDGVSINIKSPTAPADKFYNDVVSAFDAQSYADIAMRFNMPVDEFLSDLAHQGGGVILSYDQIARIEATQGYFNLKKKQAGTMLTVSVPKDSYRIIFNDEQEVAMLVLNLKNIAYNENGTVMFRKSAKYAWQDTTGRTIQRTYSKLKEVDEKLWRQTVSVVGVDDSKAYGQLWQRNCWGNNSELLEESFFDELFNGIDVNDAGRMVGAQTSLGGDVVPYWQGFIGKDKKLDAAQLKMFEEMGWGSWDNGKFVLNSENYLRAFGNFDMNSMLMGDNAFVRRFYPNQPSNLIDSFSRQANFIAAQGKTQLEWMDQLYSNNLSIRAMQEGGIHDKDIIEELQYRYREVFVGYVVSEPKSVSGLSLKEFQVFNQKDLDLAVKQGMIIIPRYEAYQTIKYLNQPRKHSKVWNFLNRVMYLYKYGWLSLNPGTLLRNWIDTELKSKIELGSDSAFYKNYADTVLKEFDIVTKTIMGKNNTKFFMTKDDIHKFFKRADVRQLGVTHVNETMYFQLNDLMQNGPMNNMVQEQYGKSMLRAVTAQTDIGSPFVKQSGENWDNFIGFIQDKNLMVQLNNKIENRNRVAIFLASLDDEMSKGGRVVAAANNLGIAESVMARELAYSRIARVHFDYGHRSPMMKKVEMLFPFLGWTLDNISYWIDIIEKKPWIINMYFNIYQPIWNFDDYTPEQLEQSQALQQMMLGGNLPILGPDGIFSDERISGEDSRTYVFKMNPSFADAFGGLSNPIGALNNRINSVVTTSTELLSGGRISFENWLANDINRNPDVYFEAGKTSPEIFKLIQKYAEVIPMAGTIYGKWYTAYRQSTGDNVPLAATGALTGRAGITSHVQLTPVSRYGSRTSFQWNKNRPPRVNHNKYRAFVGRRVSATPYATSRVMHGINPLPNKDLHKIWKKTMITPRNAIGSANTGLEKIQARKLSAKLYGINIAAFR